MHKSTHMKGHTEAVGNERRESALNGDGVGWMGLLKMNTLLDRVEGRAIFRASPGFNQDQNLIAPSKSQYALIERDLSVVDIGGVKARGEPSVNFDCDRSKRCRTMAMLQIRLCETQHGLDGVGCILLLDNEAHTFSPKRDKGIF